jgi:hypothetical protein
MTSFGPMPVEVTPGRAKKREPRDRCKKMPGVVTEPADAAKWLTEVGMIVLLLNPVPFDNAGEHA